MAAGVLSFLYTRRGDDEEAEEVAEAEMVGPPLSTASGPPTQSAVVAPYPPIPASGPPPYPPMQGYGPPQTPASAPAQTPEPAPIPHEPESPAFGGPPTGGPPGSSAAKGDDDFLDLSDDLLA